MITLRAIRAVLISSREKDIDAMTSTFTGICCFCGLQDFRCGSSIGLLGGSRYEIRSE